MTYTVTCECGKRHEVSTGDAGTTLNCSCGRAVSVPSLGVLRQQAGELGRSPEMILDSMLENGELPEDSFCVVCQARTDSVRYFEVECERVESVKVASLLSAVFFVIYGWIWGLLAYASSLRKEGTTPPRGRNVHYRLPLRICLVCDSKRDAASNKELLCRVPVYEHLLKKYPHAEISAV